MVLSFPDALAQAGQGALCSVLAVSENLNRILPAAYRGTPDGLETSRGLRRRLCGTSPTQDDGTGEIPPLFQGGQCLVFYDFTYRITSDDIANPINQSIRRSGPLSINIVDNGPGSRGILLRHRFSAPEGEGLASGSQQSNTNITVVSVVRVDGQPDNCGNTPIVLPPPGPVNVTGDVTYITNEGDSITETTNFRFGVAYFDVNGNLRFPIRVNVGDVGFNGTVEVNPEFKFNFEPGGTSNPPGVTDGTEQPNPIDPSDPTEPPGEESPPSIIGVEVFSQISSGARPSSVIFQNAPNLFVPRLGSVSFCIRTPSSLVWTADQPIKNRETYIPCPAPQGAVAVRATPEPGVTVRWNAIRSRPLLDIS